MYDVIIIGAGPAGLNAALLLGRCSRSVLVFDGNQPRNAAAQALHGFLSRDGVGPQELRRLGREELGRYPNLELREEQVGSAQVTDEGFEVSTIGGDVWRARLLLLATGRIDAIPAVPGFREYYGRGVYHCPYCDGWENRDMPFFVYGNDERAVGFARELLTWTSEVTLCSDGVPQWSAEEGAELARVGITVIEDRLEKLEGERGRLKTVCFFRREPLPCEAMFFCSACSQRSSLPERLGCAFDADGAVECDGYAATRVPGLYVAGNVRGGLHLAITAAAEGAEAAVHMNEALLEAELRSDAHPPKLARIHEPDCR